MNVGPEEIGVVTTIAKSFQWVWSKYGKDIIDASGKHLKKQWQEEGFNRAAEEYAKDMKRQYGTVKILGMEAPISLEGIFTDVNVLSKQTAFRRTPIEQLEEIYLGKASFGEVVEEGKNGMDAVDAHDKLFILGKPGAGKTTFLKYVTLQAIQGTLELVPIFVSLKSFSETNDSLFKYVARQFEICDFPDAGPFIETILKKGKAIVLCDGLDEVNKEGGIRDEVIRELVDFSNKYDESHFIVTCRVAATDYSFEHFTYVEMADFNEDQIRSFVNKWFTDNKETCEMFFYEFDKPESSRLHDLAKSPLLLTLLCIAFRETLSFPARRSEIYEEAFDALLKKWDTSRLIVRDEIYHELTLGRKRQMFSRIAAETFEKSEYLIGQEVLEHKIADYMKNLPPVDVDEDIDGEVVLKAIEAQHGMFAERAKGIYSFSHLTFQEYFTAKYIVENAQKGTIEGLIRNHFTDNRWREVFLLTAEMLGDADHFFENFQSTIDELITEDDRLTKFLRKVESEVDRIEPNIIMSRGEPFLSRAAAIGINLETAVHFMSSEKTDSSGFTIYHYDGDEIVNVIEDNEWLANLLRSGDDKNITLIMRNYGIDDSSIDARFDGDFLRFRLLLPGEHNSRIIKVLQVEYPNYINHYHKAVIKHCEQAGLTDLHRELSQLTFPISGYSEESIGRLAKELLDIVHDRSNVENYRFSEEQAKRLATYLSANSLLIDCLNNAYVSDRKAIEDRIYRLPQ